MRKLLRINNDFWTNERSLKALLIYLALALFTWMPLSQLEYGYIITDIFFNLILLSGVYAVATRWRRQLPLIIMAVLAGLFRILTFFLEEWYIIFINSMITVAFLVSLASMVIAHIIKDGPVNFYRIEGSLVVYLIIGIVMAFVYDAVELLVPGSFAFTTLTDNYTNHSFADFIYFSFVTQTTLGYGDMVPLGPVAKSFVIFQGMTGMLYPVIIIARLITLEVEHSRQRRNH